MQLYDKTNNDRAISDKKKAGAGKFVRKKRTGAKKIIALVLCVLMIMSLAACGNGTGSENSSSGSAAATAVSVSKDEVTNPENVEDLKIDNTKWQYDADNDVYYQIGISYVTDAEDADTEQLAIYVPGAYMDAEDNGDGTYTCTVNKENEVNGYTSETAPIVMPVNTPGYAAQAAATEYSYDSISDYMEAGYIYVHVGARGRSMGMGGMNGGQGSDQNPVGATGSTDSIENTNSIDGTDGTDSGSSAESTDSGSIAETGAPWGVTDFKAAIRYLRYNKDTLVGDTGSIFVFGHSGGGAQSSVLGSSGDSDLYYSYLQKIGAVMLDDDGNYISDAVSGVMAYCPITSLSTGNEAYEWMMGQYSDEDTRADGTWTAALSDDMAEAYAEYINSIGLVDEDGNTLTLEESSDGIYAAGSYYEYLKETIEESLNNFIQDTKFPYTTGQNTEQAGMDAGPGGDGGFRGGKGGMGNMGGQSEEQKTYETVQDYIDALNEDGEWIKYDEKTGKASITSVEAFVQHCKNAAKSVGAFDGTDASQTENQVFGTAAGSLHFDETMAELIENNAEEYSKYSDYDSSVSESIAADFKEKDSVGNTVSTRSDMYDPMYYLTSGSEGYGTSTVAKYWRINTGIEQSDTSLTTEMNLKLVLDQNQDVESVDFTTVWEQGHTMAERTGSSTENMIEWIDSCCK